MKRFLCLITLTLGLGVQAFAHQAFTLVSSEKKTVKPSDLAMLERDQTMGKKDKSTLTFTGSEIHILVVTGPEDDMLSFRIQGVRNPILVIPSGAMLKVLFVNIDADMKHDIRFGHVMAAFGPNPNTAETAGSEKLPAVESGGIQAEELVLKSNEDGAYKYFCSVGSHAKGGMWGHILVGVKPGPNMEMPKQTVHIHSPDEDKPDTMPGMKMPAKPTPTPPPGMDMPGMKPTPTPSSGEMSGMPGMNMPGKQAGMKTQMSSVTNIGDPMERESSGTSWNPDSSPMYARTNMYDGGGMLMLMGTGFVRYTDIGSSRNVAIAGKGDRNRFDAPTMFMAMYSHPVGKNAQVGFRGMFSLDPVIEQGWGYPLLYQSGEQYAGKPLHDRQHPHDLFSELAVTYSYKFNEKNSFYLYAGLPGEPALGPPMYLHRTSGMNIPDAPIGHHWQDSTHVSFGLVTAGVSFGKAKVEASAFNGREPDENRWNIDKPRLDSFSGRFSVNPTKDLALQISYGYIKDPERAEPSVHILRRTTASAIYNKKYDDDHNWGSSVIWGQNYVNGDRSNSFLVESNYDFFKNAVFGRYETINKSGHDLVLSGPLASGAYWLNAFNVGYIRDIVQGKGVDVGIGGMFTIDHNPQILSSVYGGTTHGGWQFFMRFRPSKMK